jgi:stage II sporulation protein D
MSQWGARGYAEQGWRYDRILRHYYRGTQVRPVPARPVRVLLADGRALVTIRSTKPFRVVDARGKKKVLKPGMQRLVPAQLAKAKLKLPLRYEPGAAPLQLDGKSYRGALVVHRRNGKLTVVNRLPLDRYLRGVVPWEMPDDWHPEALRAQAVVARSYALATLKPGTLFDLYPDTRSQVYGGIEAEEDSTNRAIGSTAGQVVSWQGRVATTFYHSTSGGRTTSNAEAWPGATPLPYLVSVRDPFDRGSKHHRWGPFELTPAEAARRLGGGAVRDLLVTRGASGRATDVTIAGTAGARRMDPTEFRRALDLRSTWFTIRVLHLEGREAPAHASLAAAGRTVVLRGFLRGLRKVRLEQQVNGGAWTAVRRVRPRADGWFTVSVAPKRTTSYRLANHVAAGAAITVKRP